MSNPAVIKLQSSKINKNRIWIDDNFGESIHIHIDDIRVDLSVQEFEKLYEDLCCTLNKLIEVEGLDFRKIDPIYLEVMLWDKLTKLKMVRIDYVNLDDMYAPFGQTMVKLSESRGVKALRGVFKEEEKRRSNHLGQTETERMAISLESIKENGYPYDNQYIVMYGDDNIIRDGQHRASCLYYLYGNIEVPVMRMYFDNYDSPNIYKYYNSKLFCFLRVAKRKISKLFKLFKIVTIKLITKIMRKIVSVLKKKVGKNVNSDIVTIFSSK